ncbi:MAG TPA: hypothetical protein EYP98_02815, partial [Planctomycetes bacterium]|nr:hypothetical protein [Planctomycetota bacterium]
VALAAPTGKAAARMKEALRTKLSEEFLPAIGRFLTDETQKQEIMTFIQEAEPRTLHRLLGWQSKNPTRFRHHANNPLPYDVVVVDEASMVDFAMMSKLASAVSGRGTGGEPTRLLLLGDRYQLASVEAGTVLADICGQTDAAALRFTKAGAAVLASYPKLDLLAAPPEARVELVEGPAFRDAVVQFDRTYRFADDSGIGAFAKACLAVPFDPKVASGILAQGGDVTLIEPNDDGRLTAAVQTAIVDGFRPYLQMLKRGQDDKDLYPTEAVFHRRVLETFDRFERDDLKVELADMTKMEEIRTRISSLIDDPNTAEALKPFYRQFC